jgi:hypothetical protein
MKKYNNMIDFGGAQYYIDINEIGKTISQKNVNSKNDDTTIIETETITTDIEGKTSITTTKQKVNNNTKDIENIKYDVIKTMIEVLVDNDDELDFTLGTERALSSTSLGYKLAFNTLYNCGILIEKE